MEKSFTDVIREVLVGKKIKLYSVVQGKLEYFIAEKGILAHPKNCKIVGESYGFVKSIETETSTYDGDFYDVVIVDDNDKPLNVSGLNNITSKFEIIP